MSENILEISQLEKTYENGFVALKGIDLNVKKGDFFALLGPNGAGKSTTLGIVSSLVNKSSGKVVVGGFDLDKQPEEVKKLLGVVPQEFNFNFFENVEDIIVQQAGYYGLSRKQAKINTEKYLKKLDLWEKRDTSARMLSGGMKRRLMIARALVHEPELLILDEPTAGVDIEIRRTMWEFLQELNDQGRTIILTTHYLEEAESLCENIAIIRQGQIVIDTNMRDLLAQLDKATFILDVDQITQEFVSNDQLKKVTDKSIEIIIKKGENLNQVFALLTQWQMNVTSIRPKTNRLEELFVDLTLEDDATNKEAN